MTTSLNDSLLNNQRNNSLISDSWTPNDISQLSRTNSYLNTKDIEIVFNNLSYTVNKNEYDLFCQKKLDEKKILKNVNGVIKGGKLNAVFGPTGIYIYIYCNL